MSGSSSDSGISFHQARNQAKSQQGGQDQDQHQLPSAAVDDGASLNKDGTRTTDEAHPISHGALTEAHSHATKGSHGNDPQGSHHKHHHDENDDVDASSSSSDEDDEASSLVTTEGGHEHETIEEHQKKLGDRANRRSERRKQRGVMQWKPARNAAFAKNEAAFALRRVKKKFMGDLSGREPDIETETGG